MVAAYARRIIAAIIRAMGAGNPEVTGEIPEITLSYLARLLESLMMNTATMLEDITKRLDHADELRHETARQVAEIHAQLEEAQPLIEKWQHSKIRRLAAGQLPWQQ
jgi:hypothetical protein